MKNTAKFRLCFLLCATLLCGCAGCKAGKTVKSWGTAIVEAVSDYLEAATAFFQGERADCTGWLTEDYWETVTVEEVKDCLKAGALPNARDVSTGRTPLNLAARFNGDRDVIKALLKAGADPNLKDYKGLTPLHWIVKWRYSFRFKWLGPTIWGKINKWVFFQGDSDHTTILLEAGADPTVRDEDGYTPLHFAAWRRDNPAVIKTLVKAGADPNARTKNDLTPLYFAGRFDNPAVIEALVQAGANPNARVKEAGTPLRVAIRFGSLAAFEALLKVGAKIGEGGEDLLGTAIYANLPELIPVLLEAGAVPHASTLWTVARSGEISNPMLMLIEAMAKAGVDLNVTNTYGNTPLHQAAKYNEDSAIIEALVKAGADLKARDEDGRTPLHEAASANDNPLVTMALLKAGADPNARDNFDNTPLHIACKRPQTGSTENPPIVLALLLAGADPNARNRDYETPLHAAADWGTPELIAALLDAGADPTVRNNYGYAPKDLVAQFGANMDTEAYSVLAQAAAEMEALYELAFWATPTVETVTAYLESGGDPNARNMYGISPLHFAATHDDPAVITALLRAGADIEARHERDVTALHLAATRSENPAVITALLRGGADIEARAENGLTPLYFAAFSNKNPAVITTLLNAGANINARAANGKTPWDAAQQNEALKGTDAYWRLK